MGLKKGGEVGGLARHITNISPFDCVNNTKNVLSVDFFNQ